MLVCVQILADHVPAVITVVQCKHSRLGCISGYIIIIANVQMQHGQLCVLLEAEIAAESSGAPPLHFFHPIHPFVLPTVFP